MAVNTAESFLESLRQSNLLTPAQLETVSLSESDPKLLAKQFVRQELLTKWQASQLLRGHHNFFLGRYKLLKELGHGGMGCVMAAEEQGGMGRKVAIKVMAKKLLENPDSVRRFLREVQAAAALNHPNVVSAYDADCVGDTYFLVMEFVR